MADEAVPEDRRAAARERLRARSLENARLEGRIDAPRGEDRVEVEVQQDKTLGDHLVERPWLAVPLLVVAAAKPGLIGSRADPDDDRPTFSLPDFVRDHSTAITAVFVLGLVSLAGLLVAFFNNWI